MCAPACQKQSAHDTLNLVRHYLEYALGYAKEMDKNESVWHPNAVPGVNVSLSNETMRLIGNAMRELERLDELVAEKNEKPKSGLDSSIINMKNMDIDHILKIGRDFQNTDTWHGAHYDTVKLLCDTIEYLRKPGTRNCDVYRTVKEAEVACHKDRGYCSSAINERISTIRFMLQDVKENAFNKSSSEGKEDNG